MSSIIEGIVRWDKSTIDWKMVHICGFLLGVMLMELVWGERLEQEKHMNLSWVNYIVGGLLVGFGTRLGNGCTSGHGICGISRLSLRSLTAVILFMSTGICSASILYLNGWGMTKERTSWDKQDTSAHFIVTPLIILIGLGTIIFRYLSDLSLL